MSTVTDASELFGELDEDLGEPSAPDAAAQAAFRLDASRPRPASPDGLPGLCNPDGDAEASGDEREWPVVLLDGQVVRGPFYRPAPDGGPMLEVYEVEVEGGKARRGGHRGRLSHDADEEDLAALIGSGAVYLAVRARSGRIIAGATVRVGPRRRSPEAPEPEDRPAPAGEGGGELVQALQGLGQMLGQQLAQQQELLTKVLQSQAESQAALREQLLEVEREKREQELKLREQELRAAREGFEAGQRRLAEMLEQWQTAPAKTQDPVQAIAETIEAGERLKALLSEKFGVQAEQQEQDGEDDFVGEVFGQMERLNDLLGQFRTLKGHGADLLTDDGPGD